MGSDGVWLRGRVEVREERRLVRVPERCSGNKQYNVEDIIMLLQWTTI